MPSEPLESDPIGDDEILYRRIPVSQGWYEPNTGEPPSPRAFRPTARDTTGLSLYRARYGSIEQTARGRPGKSYYVAVLRAGDLRAYGIEVIPRVIEGDRGHAEIPSLVYDSQKSDGSQVIQHLLATQLCRSIEGPFETPPADVDDQDP